MRNLLLLLFLCSSIPIFSSDTQLILLRPTGQTTDGMEEMEIFNDTTQIAIQINALAKETVIKEFLEIHDLLQIHLFNTKGKPIEPAYLALTDKQGGYAVKGFILIDGNQKIRKENSYYVDINIGVIDQPFNSLMSITQLYPHELGHIMYRLLSSSEGTEENSKNVNIHYFSLMTDYQIAFNEGFAEHLENISRVFEKNNSVIEGIKNDSFRIAEVSKNTVKGFTKDFKNPLRFGFYKMSMLLWYQKFEDYKRYAYAFNGNSKYRNASVRRSNANKNLIYRNSGVDFKPDELRNKVQLMSTEGTISTFFTLLSQTKAKEYYQSNQFYRTFVKDSSLLSKPIQSLFNPLQNLFIKYFYVLDKYVVLEQTQKSQLIDFIEGYLREFPVEERIIKNTYKKATGLDYDHEMPPDLWLMQKDRPHGILAIDAYAGLTIPVYTFSLNGAETEDLMMIKNLSEEDAQAILKYRDHKFFESFSEFDLVEGLSDDGKKRLLESKFDPTYFNDLEFPEELNIKSVIIAPVKNLILYTMIYFTIIMMIYFFIIRKEKLSIKKKTVIIIKYMLIWLIFVLSGLIIAAQGMHWNIILIISFSLLLISYLALKGTFRHRTLIMISLMTLTLLFSLV